MLGLEAVTVTPGSTPPVLSVTLPLIEPRGGADRLRESRARSQDSDPEYQGQGREPPHRTPSMTELSEC